jgi:NAD(P)-dependent dehydrogenase (short-subunit alcohol dehydrogenase family)
VDILVNNAGIFTESLLEDMSIEDWDRVVNTNLRGTFLCTRMLIGQMLERRDGRIINIASQLGQIGGTSVPHYVASKAGIIGLTKALAREVADRGVLVNAIAPGPIDTEANRTTTPQEMVADIVKSIPLSRMGQPEDLVGMCLFLLSDQARWITGQIFNVDGGQVIRS